MYMMQELDALLSALQTSKAQQPPETEIVASVFGLDRNLEYPLGYCETRICDITQEIKLLQARLQFLSLEQESGQIAKRRERNNLQPVARLPNEILSNILLFSMMPSNASIWRSPELAVSHRWRECALSEPNIWGHIFVNSNSQNDELITWLARSRNAPLFVHYTFQPHSTFHYQRFMMIQSLIAPHAARIRGLDYDVGFPAHFLFPLSMSLPSLEMLDVHWGGSPMSISPFDLFGRGAPSGLRTLRLDSLAFAPDQVILNEFDSSALVTLQVDETVTIPSVWSTLSRSEHLQTLSWVPQTRQQADGPFDVPVILKHLRELNLAGSIVRPVLARLDAPVLERLMIGYGPTHLQDIIPELLRRNQLRRLSLCKTGALQSSHLRDVFEALPQLEYFIHDAWTTENIPALDKLTPPVTMVESQSNSGSWHSPCLCILRIAYSLPSWDAGPQNRGGRELVQAMNKYLRPLLSRRRMYAPQPLTVVLERTELLDGLVGLEGIVWDNDYRWPDE